MAILNFKSGTQDRNGLGGDTYLGTYMILTSSNGRERENTLLHTKT